MFLEFWKRRQAVIAWEWDLANYEDEEDARPEFEVKVSLRSRVKLRNGYAS